MKPLDPRLLRHASAAGAFVVARRRGRRADRGPGASPRPSCSRDASPRAFLGGAALAALAAAAGWLCSSWSPAARCSPGPARRPRTARRADVVAQLRAALLDHVAALGPRHPGLPPTGELATLATRGVDALDGYVSRYLPQLLVAAVVPAVVAGPDPDRRLAVRR